MKLKSLIFLIILASLFLQSYIFINNINKKNTASVNVIVNPNFRIFPRTGVLQMDVVLSRHPLNPNILFASGNTNYPGGAAGYAMGSWVSTNGGANWTGYDSLFSPSFFGGNPDVTIDKNGIFIVPHLGYPTSGVYSNYSTNNGSNWSLLSIVIGGNQSNICAGTDYAPSSLYYGRSYTAWSLFTLSNPAIGLSYTTNNGVSWSAPLQMNIPLPGHFSQGAVMTCGTNGEVYVCWAAPLDISPYTEDYYGFAKSTNGGVNWTVNENIFDGNGIRGTIPSKGNIRVNSFPKMDIDRYGGVRNGWIYIVGCDRNLSPAGSDPDIILHISTDGGATLSTGIRVNQDALNNGKYQFFPSIRVDESGGINILYYDDRNVASNQCEVYLSRSIDGGSTWSDILVSDHIFIPDISPGNSWSIKTAITSANNKIISLWVDNYGGVYQVWEAIINNLIGINSGQTVSGIFSLSQNYPNPFNPVTSIKYSIPKQSIVKLVVYDLIGREVKELVNGNKQAGYYEAEFDASNFASGVYFYKLEANEFVDVKKMVVIK